MKIKEINEAGILSKIGTGLVRGLDKLGGGTGSNVGTAQQQKTRQQALLKKANQRANLDKVAAEDFKQQMDAQGIKFDPADPTSAQAYSQEAQKFATTFFAGGESDPEVKSYIVQQIKTHPLPRNATEQMVNKYFNEINDIRTKALLQKEQGRLQGYTATQARAQDAMDNLAGSPVAHRVGTYSAPKPQPGGASGNPQVNVVNHTYTYDYNLKKWTDENKLPVNDKADEQELHKRWEEINGNPPSGGATPAEIRSAQQKNTQQKIDRETQAVQGQTAANPPEAPAATPAQLAQRKASNEKWLNMTKGLQPSDPTPNVFRSNRPATPAAAPAKPKYKPDGRGGFTQVDENIDFGKMLWDRMKNKR